MVSTVPAREKRSVVHVWSALTLITLLAWRLSPDQDAALGKELVAGIVVLGLIKCRFVIRCFMEVRHAPRWLRIATDTWLVLLWGALLGIYLWS